MNNGDESLLTFVTNSSLRNLSIVCCNTTTECKNKLRQGYWDAVLLNAEPKRLEHEIPQIRNLRDAYVDIIKCDNTVPIFVVTANKAIDDFNKQLAQVWAGGRFYELPDSSSQLYEDIKAEVENNEDYRIHKEFEVVCDFYSQIDGSDKLLIELLKGLKDENLDKEQLIPANVRLILDKVMTFLTNIGILHDNPFSGSNLRECSIELGKKGNVVPYHVQRFFHSCVDISNNGNHQIPEGNNVSNKKRTGNPLFVQKQITNCEAPYLNKALIYDLLNILYWCATLKMTEKNG